MSIRIRNLIQKDLNKGPKIYLESWFLFCKQGVDSFLFMLMMQIYNICIGIVLQPFNISLRVVFIAYAKSTIKLGNGRAS